MAELKPCPFCGGVKIKMYAFDFDPDCHIGCQQCGAAIWTEVRWKKRESVEHHDERCWKKLAKKWNRRRKEGE